MPLQAVTLINRMKCQQVHSPVTLVALESIKSDTGGGTGGAGGGDDVSIADMTSVSRHTAHYIWKSNTSRYYC